MSGPFDFIHIKGSTAGSSNELSFDVLDAASRGITESKKVRARKTTSAPKPKQGSYHGVKGTSTLSSAPEVERRKRARRSRAIRVRVLGVIALIAAVSLIGYGSYTFYQGRVDFNSRLNGLIEQLSSFDDALIEVDTLMKDPLSSAQSDARSSAAAAYGERVSGLSQLAADANGATEYFAEDSEIAALSGVAVAAEAREDMLKAANDTFALASIVNDQKTSANEAWSHALEADALAREAAELSNEAATVEATQAARQKTEEAKALFEEAREDLEDVEQSVSGLSYSDELAYIDKRIESLDAALATADALLSLDRDAATAQNNAYNRADSEAAAMAQSLAVSVDERVEAAFSDELQQCIDAYSAARAEVSTADATLRRLRG